MIGRRAARWLTCLTLSAGAACGPGTAGDDTAGGEVVRTIVRRLSDGSTAVSTETVSRAEFDRDVATRQAVIDGTTTEGVSRDALTTQDTGCSPASLWLFDNPGNTPGPFPYNHQICFIDSDPSNEKYSAIMFDLDQYDHLCFEWVTLNPLQHHRECRKWATGGLSASATSQVRSLWAGKDVGEFAAAGQVVAKGEFYRLRFGRYQRIDTIRSDFAATIGFLADH